MNENFDTATETGPLWLTASTQAGDAIDLPHAADCRCGDVSVAVSRVHARDLRAAATAVRRIKSHAVERGQAPPPTVAAISVHIAENAAKARANATRYSGNPGAESISYVGTPSGLASLIADLHTLAVADGAHLIICDRGSETLLGEVIRHLSDRQKRCACFLFDQCIGVPA